METGLHLQVLFEFCNRIKTQSWSKLCPPSPVFLFFFLLNSPKRLPPGATLLASNDKGIQAFRVGSKIVCLQGHPECGVEQGLYFLHPEIPLDPNIVKEAEKTISEFGAGDTSLIGTLVWKLLLPELVGTMT